jgi:hypothetical protein
MDRGKVWSAEASPRQALLEAAHAGEPPAVHI